MTFPQKPARRYTNPRMGARAVQEQERQEEEEPRIWWDETDRCVYVPSGTGTRLSDTHAAPPPGAVRLVPESALSAVRAELEAARQQNYDDRMAQAEALGAAYRELEAAREGALQRDEIAQYLAEHQESVEWTTRTADAVKTLLEGKDAALAQARRDRDRFARTIEYCVKEVDTLRAELASLREELAAWKGEANMVHGYDTGDFDALLAHWRDEAENGHGANRAGLLKALEQLQGVVDQQPNLTPRGSLPDNAEERFAARFKHFAPNHVALAKVAMHEVETWQVAGSPDWSDLARTIDYLNGRGYSDEALGAEIRRVFEKIGASPVVPAAAEPYEPDSDPVAERGWAAAVPVEPPAADEGICLCGRPLTPEQVEIRRRWQQEDFEDDPAPAAPGVAPAREVVSGTCFRCDGNREAGHPLCERCRAEDGMPTPAIGEAELRHAIELSSEYDSEVNPLQDNSIPEPRDFRDELTSLLNRHSMENESGTPDFILAFFLGEVLEAFDKTLRRRDSWRGKMDKTVAAPNEVPATPSLGEENPQPPDDRPGWVRGEHCWTRQDGGSRTVADDPWKEGDRVEYDMHVAMGSRATRLVRGVLKGVEWEITRVCLQPDDGRDCIWISNVDGLRRPAPPVVGEGAEAWEPKAGDMVWTTGNPGLGYGEVRELGFSRTESEAFVYFEAERMAAWCSFSDLRPAPSVSPTEEKPK